MKKMFCLIFFVSLIFFAGFKNVSANMQDALNISKSAFKATDDYSDIVNSGNYDVAKIRLQDCERHSEILNFFLDNVQTKNETECLMLADVVLMDRGATLYYYIKAVDAHRENNSLLYNEFLSKLYAQAEQAFSSRRTFLNKYGF